MTENTTPVITTLHDDDSLLQIALARPKGNIIDRPMMTAIATALDTCRSKPGIRSILFTGEGPNFSFGASVEEHRPETVSVMLPEFHGLFRNLAATGRVMIAAVRGACLGGGLELAGFCQRICAAPDAKLGNPEIKLGVFAPVASLVLPQRVGQARAEDLLLTGRTIDAREALAIGLVDEVADNPSDAAREWHRKYIMPLSGSAVGHAVRAARLSFHDNLHQLLERLERQYLDELMQTEDAREGINAFLEKRPPQWRHK